MNTSESPERGTIELVASVTEDHTILRVTPMQARLVEEILEGIPEVYAERIREAYRQGQDIGNAGLDLRYAGDKTIYLQPQSQIRIHTGLSIWIRNPMLFGAIVPRSGAGSKGLVLGNLTGIIDSTYQGELLITLWNRNPQGSPAIEIEPTERVAQLIIQPKHHPEMTFVDAYEDTTHRGLGGFNSTGRI